MTARLFTLERDHDESGVYGTGTVAEGVEFSDGRVAMAWMTHLSSVAFYPNIRHVEAIHGHGGMTRIVYNNDVADPS